MLWETSVLEQEGYTKMENNKNAKSRDLIGKRITGMTICKCNCKGGEIVQGLERMVTVINDTLACLITSIIMFISCLCLFSFMF